MGSAKKQHDRMCSNLHVPDEAEQTALRPFPNQRSPTNDLLPSILLRFLTGRWTAKHFSITARSTDTVYIQNSPGEIYTRRVFFKRNLWKTPSTRVRSQKPSPFSGCGAYGSARRNVADLRAADTGHQPETAAEIHSSNPPTPFSQMQP